MPQSLVEELQRLNLLWPSEPDNRDVKARAKRRRADIGTAAAVDQQENDQQWNRLANRYSRIEGRPDVTMMPGTPRPNIQDYQPKFSPGDRVGRTIGSVLGGGNIFEVLNTLFNYKDVKRAGAARAHQADVEQWYEREGQRSEINKNRRQGQSYTDASALEALQALGEVPGRSAVLKDRLANESTAADIASKELGNLYKPWEQRRESMSEQIGALRDLAAANRDNVEAQNVGKATPMHPEEIRKIQAEIAKIKAETAQKVTDNTYRQYVAEQFSDAVRTRTGIAKLKAELLRAEANGLPPKAVNDLTRKLRRLEAAPSVEERIKIVADFEEALQIQSLIGPHMGLLEVLMQQSARTGPQ